MDSFSAFIEFSELLDGINVVGQYFTAFLVMAIVFALVFGIPMATYRYAKNYALENAKKQDDSSIHLVYVKASTVTIIVFMLCCQIVNFIFIAVLGVYASLGEALNELLMLNNFN